MTPPTELTLPAAHTVRTVVEIAAPPERVFRALTDPRELAAWWGGDSGARVLDCSADPRPGGSWRVRTIEPNGAEREAAGEYRAVDLPRRLEQSWRAADDEAPSVVRYDLEPLDVGGTDGTRLTVTHTSPTALTAGAAVAFGAAALPALAARLALRPAFPSTVRRFQPAWCGAPSRGVARARRATHISTS